MALALGAGLTACASDPEDGLANASPAFRRRCDSATACGDDYVCAGVVGAPKGVGAARVDGHQVP